MQRAWEMRKVHLDTPKALHLFWGPTNINGGANASLFRDTQAPAQMHGPWAAFPPFATARIPYADQGLGRDTA